MPRQKCSTLAFQKLLSKILEKSGFTIKEMRENSSRVLGFQNGDPYPLNGDDTLYDKKTVKGEILKDEAVLEYFKGYCIKKRKITSRDIPIEELGQYFNAQHLYRKYKDTEKEKFVNIDDPYLSIYLIYIGYKSIEDIEAEIAQSDDKPLKYEYKGYYYDYRKHAIDSFDFHLVFEQDVPVRAELKKSHASKKDLSLSYDGKVEKLGQNKLKIQLDSSENQFSMTLIAFVGGSYEEDLMLCAISAISSDNNYPINTEAVLYRKNLDKPIGKEDELKVKRFLFLHRYYFRIRSKVVRLGNLEAKNVDVNELKKMKVIGEWQTMRFSDDYKNIVLSKFLVEDTYKCSYETSVYNDSNYNKQVCIVNINTNDPYQNNKTLCISMHPNIGIGVIAYMILRKEENNINSKLNIMKGYISFTSNSDGKPFTRPIVMFRTQEESVIENMEVSKFLDQPDQKNEKNKPELLRLYETLVSEEKRNASKFKNDDDD